MNGFVHGIRQTDDKSQNVADDERRLKVTAFHLLHLEHDGIGQTGNNSQHIAKHAAGSDFVEEEADNAHQCDDAGDNCTFVRFLMVKNPENQNQKDRMGKLEDNGIGSGGHFGGTDKSDAHGSGADTAENDGWIDPERMVNYPHIDQQSDEGKNTSYTADG